MVLEPIPRNRPTALAGRRPRSTQTDNRTETYWYDPARRLWVKFAEKQHGQQTFAGFTLTYDEQLVATLSSFTPA